VCVCVHGWCCGAHPRFQSQRTGLPVLPTPHLPYEVLDALLAEEVLGAPMHCDFERCVLVAFADAERHDPHRFSIAISHLQSAVGPFLEGFVVFYARVNSFPVRLEHFCLPLKNAAPEQRHMNRLRFAKREHKSTSQLEAASVSCVQTRNLLVCL
jgi:hypothetical protein